VVRRRPSEPDLSRGLAYERAWQQVRAIKRFYRHALIYLMVISGLITLNLIVSPQKLWFIYPASGWGLGLLFHGVSVWGGAFWLGREWEEKKIQEILAREKIRTLSTEKQLAEAQLRLLQAQIEPHFLFNTLANVVSLIEPAPAKAQLMLENFISYLRASLAASRSVQGTFAQEESLLRHYLELLQMRMGQRLQFELSMEPSLQSEPLAPMLLQPIVENAIRHGLEPKVEGGRVMVSARRAGGRVNVVVEDNGLGFHPGESSGIGLENLRQRLDVLYSGQAQLQIQDAQPGTRVLLDLPAQ
jgi:LytS/YehU family sensor histidine kinase